MNIRPALVLTFTALISLFAAASAPAQSASEPRKLTLLWAGSSSSYWHSQPRQAAAWLTRGGVPAESHIVGRSGDGIHVYLRPGFDRYEYGVQKGQTFMDRLKQGGHDYVILQVVTNFIAGKDGSEHAAAVETYIKTAREAGAKPLIYEMGWGRDAVNEEGRRKIFDLARRHQTPIVPCSTAWQRVYAERPDLDMQADHDRTHPGPVGMYLNLCLFYAAIAGKPPVDVPSQVTVWPKLSPEEKKAAGEKIAGMKLDDYDSRLAGWMKPAAVNAAVVNIDASTAKYLQTVAWEEWQKMHARLKGE